MARTSRTTLRRQEPVKPMRYCRDCAHSYDWHSKALDGSLILCRCPYDERTEHGRWCKFLADRECERFQPRPTK